MDLPQPDLDQLRSLMKLMEQFDFQEIDLRDDKRRIHLLRTPKELPGQAVVMPTMLSGAMPAAAAAAPAASADPASPPPGVKVVTSPMVGTYYEAPNPDSSPFVEEGQAISEDTTLCIIEAMKVMNEIKAECSGEVVKVLVKNGQAVEYGEPLFHVKLAT
ncbi:MAG: acetyl-CoA carboxylase biotin carboxyl carrier protein [Planctomycetes bacterium]|nr:acetyl-CoA carboxylase biotin carboxyl carrier protein [Planctomycetota bacterium]